jgi:hypothetical protein
MALGSTQPLTEMSTKRIFWGDKGGRCVRLTTYHHPVPLSWNLGTLTSWNPLGHSRPVTGLLYLLFTMPPVNYVRKPSTIITIIIIYWHDHSPGPESGYTQHLLHREKIPQSWSPFSWWRYWWHLSCHFTMFLALYFNVIIPWCNPQQIHCPNPVRWEHDNTKHTLRQSQIIIIQLADHKFSDK